MEDRSRLGVSSLALSLVKGMKGTLIVLIVGLAPVTKKDFTGGR